MDPRLFRRFLQRLGGITVTLIDEADDLEAAFIFRKPDTDKPGAVLGTDGRSHIAFSLLTLPWSILHGLITERAVVFFLGDGFHS